MKIVECIRNSMDRRIQYYVEDIRKLNENRSMPTWSFCDFFAAKVRIAHCNVFWGVYAPVSNVSLDCCVFVTMSI